MSPLSTPPTSVPTEHSSKVQDDGMLLHIGKNLKKINSTSAAAGGEVEVKSKVDLEMTTKPARVQTYTIRHLRRSPLARGISKITSSHGYLMPFSSRGLSVYLLSCGRILLDGTLCGYTAERKAQDPPFIRGQASSGKHRHYYSYAKAIKPRSEPPVLETPMTFEDALMLVQGLMPDSVMIRNECGEVSYNDWKEGRKPYPICKRPSVNFAASTDDSLKGLVGRSFGPLRA